MRIVNYLSKDHLRELNVKLQQLPEEKKVPHERVNWMYFMGMNGIRIEGKEVRLGGGNVVI